MLRISLRKRRGDLLAETAVRNAHRSHWYRLAGMRRWALVLVVADEGFTREYDRPERVYDASEPTP